MVFEKMEQFNKEPNKKEKVDIVDEAQEENILNQDPDYGVLSEDRTFETRKHLFDLIQEAKKEKNKDKILGIKEEINKIIDSKEE